MSAEQAACDLRNIAIGAPVPVAPTEETIKSSFDELLATRPSNDEKLEPGLQYLDRAKRLRDLALERLSGGMPDTRAVNIAYQVVLERLPSEP